MSPLSEIKLSPYRPRAIFHLHLILMLILPLGFARADNAAPGNKTAQSSPQTILDYFARLPAEYVYYLQNNASQDRQALIRVKDVKNGYLKLMASDWEGWAELALFKKKTGGYALAVADTDCSPTCATALRFVEFQSPDTWTDVTDALYPTMNHSEELMIYALPRIGTTIEIRRAGDIKKPHPTVKKLSWNGVVFH